MTEKLKACPFCGGKADLQHRKGKYAGSYVSCHTEDCCGHPSDDSFSFVKEEHAIAAWNARAIEEVVGILEFIANGCLVAPDGGEPHLMDAIIEAKRALRILNGGG